MTDFSKKQFQTLIGYHWHTLLRLVDCAARLETAEIQENPGYGRGSIHDILFHLLRSSRGRRLALQTGKQPAGLSPEGYDTLAAVRAELVEERQAWLDMLDGLTPSQIEGDVTLTNSHGKVSETPRWIVLQHFVLHGMQHHSELAQLLTARGQSPGNIDFILYEPAGDQG